MWRASGFLFELTMGANRIMALGGVACVSTQSAAVCLQRHLVRLAAARCCRGYHRHRQGTAGGGNANEHDGGQDNGMSEGSGGGDRGFEEDDANDPHIGTSQRVGSGSRGSTEIGQATKPGAGVRRCGQIEQTGGGDVSVAEGEIAPSARPPAAARGQCYRVLADLRNLAEWPDEAHPAASPAEVAPPGLPGAGARVGRSLAAACIDARTLHMTVAICTLYRPAHRHVGWMLLLALNM